MTLTVAILAGGKSSRMGRNKALLHIGEQALITRVIQASKPLLPSELLIVTNTPADYEHLGYRIATDTIKEQGAIGGIVSALHYSQTDAVLVLACDLPFVRTNLLKLLVHEFDQGHYQAVIPTVAGYPQGILAVYHRKCLPYFESAIQNDQRKLKTIFGRLEHVMYIDESQWQTADPQGLSFNNVNTPDDLKLARKLWRQHQKIEKPS